MGVRPEVLRLHAMGPWPSEREATIEAIDAIQAAVEAIAPPLSAEEAHLLMKCFGPDDCFGLAWALLHLIETSDATFTMPRPPDDANEWVLRLWQGVQNWRARAMPH